MSLLYDRDFFAWTQEQVNLLKQGKWHELDVPNLIEELETLGRQERRELVNRLTVLLAHLLKWQFQPEKRTRSWLTTLRNQRIEIEQLLLDNPSLQAYLAEALDLAYRKAVNEASGATNLPSTLFPSACPYRLEEVLDDRFYPGEPATGFEELQGEDRSQGG